MGRINTHSGNGLLVPVASHACSVAPRYVFGLSISIAHKPPISGECVYTLCVYVGPSQSVHLHHSQGFCCLCKH